MINDDESRPSPETLLKISEAEEKQKRQGRLKIFLGYAAGVGKTYAMLEAAQRRKAEHRDVVVGYVETHGRSETDALLEGLEIVPRAKVNYAGMTLKEMNIDAILARRPQVALVDELAHTNAPGSRHQKRWQDVEELLAAGIDIYTTVNIQHFESLNDVVAQITGIKVRETVPDRLLDQAAEIRLVDIPPEDLLQRLQEGRVYIPEQATLAAQEFFKPGNLMALRELSLRRTASRVDDQIRAYMESSSVRKPLPTGERILVCISGSPFSERLIRTARRLADDIKAPWHAVYIECPGGGKQFKENRERVWHDLRLAESLGAQVATITAAKTSDAVLDYAARHNITKIVIGKPSRPRWREFLRPPFVDQIIRLSGTIDVYVVSITSKGRKPQAKAVPAKTGTAWPGYLKSVALVAVTSGICQIFHFFLAPTNLVMFYLLAVVLAAFYLGLKPAILTALLSVLAFDYLFVPPTFSFTVFDTEYLVTFLALFIVGVVISSLVTKLRDHADVIRKREVQTANLYYLSRDLAAAADTKAILEAVIRNIGEIFNAQLAILLPEGERLEIKAVSENLVLNIKEMAVADWAYRNRQAAGQGTETLSSAALLYIPLQTSGSVLGVLGVLFRDETEYMSPENRKLLVAFANQTALAVERVQLSKQAEQAQVVQARESLERALLNSVSHDLRTPLVSITGALSTLREEEQRLSRESRKELLDAAWDQSVRLNRFVGNLLDMTRLEAGAIKLRKEPCDIQDVVGCALAALESQIANREVAVHILPGLPLVSMDMALMTQVLVNLLDNALKYSALGSSIDMDAGIDGSLFKLEVSDRGPGVDESNLKRIFDKFYRLPIPEGVGGTGLGLSICKGVVEAHGGQISAENRFGGGLKVIIRLPLS